MPFGENDIDPLKEGGGLPQEQAAKPQGFGVNDIDPMAPPKEMAVEADSKGGFIASSDLPELGSTIALMREKPSDAEFTPGELVRIQMAANAPRSIPGKVNALKRVVPDLGVKVDDEGTVVVNIGGKDYLLNRPGFSAQDVREVATDVGFDLPFGAAGAGAGGLLAGNIGRVVGAGVGAAAGSAARDLTAQQIGSEEPIDKTSALVAGLTGGAFEALGIALTPFLRRVFGNKKFIEPGTRQLTEQGRKVLSKVGIDPDEVTPQFVDDFMRLQSQTASPEVAARQAQVNTLARDAGTEPVPMSRGDLTRQPADQAMEDAARKGVMGDQARNQAVGFRQGQQESLASTGEAIQTRIGQGQALAPGEGGGVMQGALATERNALKAQTDAAYTAARESTASLDTAGVKALGREVRRGLSEFNPATAPKAFRIADDLAKVDARFPGKVTRVKVNALENWRQQMTALARSNDPVEAAAARKAISQYDDYMARAVDDALIQGDEGAIQAFRNAGRLRKDLAQKFESDNLVKKIVETADGELKLTPTEAVNVLFTAGNSGLTGKQGAVRAIRKIADVLGKDSAEFAALKQEAFLKLLGAGEGGLDDAFRRTFSGDKFARAVDKAFRQSPELMTTLFSGEELKLIRQFRNVALMATNRTTGAVNTSNTAIVDRLLSKMGFLGNMARDSLRGFFSGAIDSRAGRQAAESFTRPLRPARPLLPPGVAGTGGAAAGQEVER